MAQSNDMKGLTESLSLFKKVLFTLLAVFLTFAVIFAFGEAALRLIGKKPYSAEFKFNFRIEPENRLYNRDPLLGYSNKPGCYKVIFTSPERNKAYTAVYTNGADSLRITRPVDAAPDSRARGLWIFGCSMTYGWSLSDGETYPWLLQKAMPDYDVKNFGVSGYGPLQSLLQFRREIEKEKKPEVVVLAYASFHDMRNTFSLNRRMSIIAWDKFGPLDQPYARIKRGKLDIQMAEYGLSLKPLMQKSVLITMLVKTYALFEPMILKERQVSQAIVSEFNDECGKKGIKFVVAGIGCDPSTKEFLDWSKAQGIHTVDISVNLKDRGMSNKPYDSHPSAAANKIYARKLQRFLLDKGFAEQK